MADETQLLYLEPDDEITTVVRRLREANAQRVVLVASGRTKATTSAVALRLLAQVAAEENREVALVADPAARALAAEAGIPAFASVGDANAEGAVPLEPPPALRAPIHVVRGEMEPAVPELPAVDLAAASVVAPRGMDETQAVPVQRPSRYPVPRQPPEAARPRTARSRTAAAPLGRRAQLALAGAALLVLAGLGAALAIVLPAATVEIRPQAVAIGPLTYEVRPDVHAPSGGEPLTSTQQGEATGHRAKRTAASGTVTFVNHTNDRVFVPSGTEVSAGGEIVFRTTQAVTVPDTFVFPGEVDAPIVAVQRGTSGNLPAEAIDTIEDRAIDRALGGKRDRTVVNRNPTGGGAEDELLVVRESDISAVTDAIRQDLRRQLADQRAESGGNRFYPSQGGVPRPKIDVPDDLRGHTSTDPFTFELTGTLEDDQPYVLRADVEVAARAAIADDESAAPDGTAIQPDSVEVKLGDATLEGGDVVVQAEVTAQAAPQWDDSAVRARIAGQTKKQAEAALSSIGPTTVSLWPFWVDRVPSLDWRVKVDVQSVEPARQ
jgi:hypothetical protein